MPENIHEKNPPILFEVHTLPSGMPAGSSRTLKDVSFTKIGQKFVEIPVAILKDSLKGLSEIGKTIAEQLQTASPDEIEVEMSIKIGADAKAFIGLAGEGNIAVKMKWAKTND